LLLILIFKQVSLPTAIFGSLPRAYHNGVQFSRQTEIGGWKKKKDKKKGKQFLS
jgi:hypothetical protein